MATYRALSTDVLFVSVQQAQFYLYATQTLIGDGFMVRSSCQTLPNVELTRLEGVSVVYSMGSSAGRHHSTGNSVLH